MCVHPVPTPHSRTSLLPGGRPRCFSNERSHVLSSRLSLSSRAVRSDTVAMATSRVRFSNRELIGGNFDGSKKRGNSELWRGGNFEFEIRFGFVVGCLHTVNLMRCRH